MPKIVGADVRRRNTLLVGADVRRRTRRSARRAIRPTTIRPAAGSQYRMVARSVSSRQLWSRPPSLANQLSRLVDIVLKFYETEPFLNDDH
jgi:hypothetical protein